MREYRALFLIIVLAALPALMLTTSSTETTHFYVEVEYFLEGSTELNIILGANEVREIIAPPEPEGFKLEYMVVTTKTGYIPKELTPVSTTFEKEIIQGDKIYAIVSKTGKLKIVNSGSKNFTTTLLVKTLYVKRSWYKVSRETPEIVFNITKPDDPLFTLSNLTVKITIDNYAPYRIVDIIDPSGKSLVSLEAESKISAKSFSVDLKHVVLDFSEGDLKEGTYAIKLKYSTEAILPSAFIVRNEKILKDSIPPESQKSFSEKTQSGGRHLGYVVILYSVIPETSYTKAKVKITSSLVDLVFHEAQEIVTKGASYLVPPLRFKFWVKAYIVFGDKFTIVNDLKEPVNVMYMPVTIVPTGKWTPEELIAEVKSEHLEGAEYAYLVVQLPPNAYIEKVVSPSGVTYQKYLNSYIPWGSANRSVSVSGREMYIQVKSRNLIETGSYRISVKWLPIQIKVVDYKGKPIADAEVVIKTSSVMFKKSSGKDGKIVFKPYIPGIYELAVYFKGKLVNKTIVPAFYKESMTIRCSVYDLKIVTVGARGQTLSDTVIMIIDTETDSELYSGISDSNGYCVFEQVPAGEYTIIAKYKRVSASTRIKVTGPLEKKIQLDVFLETPFANIPLTTKETIGLILALVTLAGVLKWYSSRTHKVEN